MKEENQQIHEFSSDLIIRVGEKVRECFKKVGVRQKSSNNLVTEADLLSEKEIVEQIQKKFPTHTILSEESHSKTIIDNASDLWIIDPIDGTNNFAHGIPQYCISIAFAKKGQVQMGWIYDPSRKELFYARKGYGAFLNGERIGISLNKTLQDSIIATGFFYNRGETMRKTLKSIESLFEVNIRGIRRMGSAALDLCWVACGRFEAYFEYNLYPWDFAAGALIAVESGAVVEGVDKEKWNLTSSGIVASQPDVFRMLCDIIL